MSSLSNSEKARQFAEESFSHGNLDLAIKNAAIAIEYNPELPSICDYITAYMVHKAVSCNRSWYNVLAIKDFSADTETIRKQYKKLALRVHPDKNKSVAAPSAFRFINQAWNILSNPSKRKAYDLELRRNRSKKRKFSSDSSKHPSSNPFKSWLSRSQDHKPVTTRYGPTSFDNIEPASKRCKANAQF